jgi:hypothetical protein
MAKHAPAPESGTFLSPVTLTSQAKSRMIHVHTITMAAAMISLARLMGIKPKALRADHVLTPPPFALPPSNASRQRVRLPRFSQQQNAV